MAQLHASYMVLFVHQLGRQFLPQLVADFKRSYSLSEVSCFISRNVRSLALGVLHYPPFVILYQLGTKNQFGKNRTNTICVFYRDLSISLPFFEILSLLYIRKCCFNVFNCRQLALYIFRHELRQLIFGDAYWLIG